MQGGQREKDKNVEQLPKTPTLDITVGTPCITLSHVIKVMFLCWNFANKGGRRSGGLFHESQR